MYKMGIYKMILIQSDITPNPKCTKCDGWSKFKISKSPKPGVAYFCHSQSQTLGQSLWRHYCRYSTRPPGHLARLQKPHYCSRWHHDATQFWVPTHNCIHPPTSLSPNCYTPIASHHAQQPPPTPMRSLLPCHKTNTRPH